MSDKEDIFLTLLLKTFQEGSQELNITDFGT